MRYLLFIIFVFAAACGKVERSSPDAFFSMDSLVNAQIGSLSQQQVAVVKSANVQGNESTTTIIPDSLGWARELGIFKRADINKPTLLERYEVTENKTIGGLLEKRYINNSGKTLTVQYLAVRYFETAIPANIREIEAVIHDNNPIYKSKRKISMEFDEFQQELRLTSYTVQGGQQMELRDSVDFIVSSILRYD